jgi:hypothetical protein
LLWTRPGIFIIRKGMKFDLTRYHRQLPQDAKYGRNVFDIEGVGKFFLRGVGNTSYCTGTEVYLHRTRRKGMNEYLIYHAHITDDGQIVWRNGSLNWQIRYGHPDCGGPADESRFPRHVLPIVYRLLDEGAEREPTSYIFSVMSSCDAEINRFRFDTKEMRDTIDHMNDLLNPAEYRPGEWGKVPLDKLAHWHSLRDRTMIKLINYMAENGERVGMLERINRAAHRWCSHTSLERKIPVRDLIAQAVAERSPRKAPPMAKMWD